jgi:hypothetical protein
MGTEQAPCIVCSPGSRLAWPRWVHWRAGEIKCDCGGQPSCPACKGSGKRVCWQCSGTGWVNVNTPGAMY